ncbi:hypothetical protein [Candidatus Leptofilum sp.]|uniref:hypothetical protein n=1 Tax=Candidatus Leptofilum sp. TaxID=3241576 RepID=UPI003B5BDCE2
MLRLKRLPILIATFLVMLGAGWLYWPTVWLPLIYDTLLHIRIVGGLDFGTVWLPTEAFGFYRPMTFFPMLIIEALFGGYPAWLLHGNNVVQHAANAGLLAWLSWRLWPDWRRAFAAGAIFATFPFAYQAVAVYGHNVHPAMTGLVLLGLHSYLTAVSSKEGTQSFTEEPQRTIEKKSSKSADKKTHKWQFITWVLFGLMVLTNETVVLFGGFAALVHICTQPELLTQPRQLLRQPWRWFLLAGLVYLVVYQFLPISRAPQAAAVGQDLWLNGLYLLQAAVFPLAWFAHLLPNVSGQLITLVGAALVLAAAGWLAWQKPAWRAPLLLAGGWWAATSLLLAITLPTDYLLRGPRLLYLGSVGVALLWAHLLAGVRNGRFTKTTTGKEDNSKISVSSVVSFRWLVWTAVLTFILLTSIQFVRTKLTQYEQLTEPVRVSQSTEDVHIPNSEIVYVNLPRWLDVPPNTYAIGVEFVAMLGDYLFVEELTNANNIGKGEAWAVELPELQSQTEYAYGIHAQHSWPPLTDKPRVLLITEYAAEQPQTQLTGSLAYLPMTEEPAYITAQFDTHQLSLGDPDEYGARKMAVACGNVVNVRLIWRQRYTNIPDTTSVFVQVLDADGRLLAQSDGPPLGIRPSLLGATPDWTLFDLREIPLEEGQTPHTLLVGVYDFATGERSPATDNYGQTLPDNAWREPISTCSKTE